MLQQLALETNALPGRGSGQGPRGLMSAGVLHGAGILTGFAVMTGLDHITTKTIC
jgi:hypothetical protein